MELDQKVNDAADVRRGRGNAKFPPRPPGACIRIALVLRERCDYNISNAKDRVRSALPLLLLSTVLSAPACARRMLPVCTLSVVQVDVLMVQVTTNVVVVASLEVGF